MAYKGSFGSCNIQMIQKSEEKRSEKKTRRKNDLRGRFYNVGLFLVQNPPGSYYSHTKALIPC